jgi:hypothetical protein
MKLYKYPDRRVKGRTHRHVIMPKEEFERLLNVSNEWELIKLIKNKAIFRVKPKIVNQ